MRLRRAAPVVLSISMAALTARADEPLEQRVDGGVSIGGKDRKPFDPDTEKRLTGEELAEQGVENLAEALELIPEIAVREGGRGGFFLDLRGAKQRAVLVLIDGVPVD